MAESRNSSDSRFDRMQKRVSFALAIAAFLLSLYNFASAHLLNQHVLRAAVVAVEHRSDTLTAKLLLINPGKNDETLYSARLLFGGTLYGDTSIGPVVLRAGEARIETLREPVDIRLLRETGIVEPGTNRLPIAVEFLPVTRDGELLENGTVYGFTQWTLSGDSVVGAAPAPTDREGLVALKL